MRYLKLYELQMVTMKTYKRTWSCFHQDKLTFQSDGCLTVHLPHEII